MKCRQSKCKKAIVYSVVFKKKRLENQADFNCAVYYFTALLVSKIKFPDNTLSILFYSILFYSILFYSILFYSILFYHIIS